MDGHSPQAGPGGGTHRNGLRLGAHQPCKPLAGPSSQSRERRLPPASKPVAELWFLCCLVRPLRCVRVCVFTLVWGVGLAGRPGKRVFLLPLLSPLPPRAHHLVGMEMGLKGGLPGQ